MQLDPITTEVVINRLNEAAAAMAHALFHSGYSPILRESQDGTAGLTLADGRVFVVGGGIKYHSLLYSRAVAAVVARYPFERMRTGDSFICNDPYKVGNSHVPDFVVVTPCFYKGEIVAFGVSVAHKADVGGIVPGSSGAAAREIFHDGILIPPVRYFTEAGVNPEVEAILRNNSRVPEAVIGDLRGQVGATRLGAQRFAALADEYGLDVIRAAVDSLLASTKRRVQGEIAKWRDGEAEGEFFHDHDGTGDNKRVRIHVKATKKGNTLTLDFSGTDPQGKGPINVPRPTAEAVSCIAVLAAADPTIPMNTGVREAIEFVIPEGIVCNPRWPATVNHYFPTAHIVHACVLSALGKLNPARAVAPSGFGTGAIAIGYAKARTGKPAVQYELMNCGLGGTATHDGTPIVMPINHFTPSTPIEIVETEYPIRVKRFDMWPDSAGAGKQRGGVGYTREYEMLMPTMLTARTSNHREGASGLNGGKGPPVARTIIDPGTAGEIALGAIETRQVAAGSTVRLDQSGGGGYGNPFERPPELVAQDVADGYVTVASAKRDYGVALTAAGGVDEAATAALRGRR